MTILRKHRQILDTFATAQRFDGFWQDAIYQEPATVTLSTATGTTTEIAGKQHTTRVKIETLDRREFDLDTVRPDDVLADLPPKALETFTPALEGRLITGGVTYQILRRMPESGDRLHLRVAG